VQLVGWADGVSDCPLGHAHAHAHPNVPICTTWPPPLTASRRDLALVAGTLLPSWLPADAVAAWLRLLKTVDKRDKAMGRGSSYADRALRAMKAATVKA